MNDFELTVIDLLDEAIKHGKHNQASHGRRTARRRAYSAAYSQARAGGASPAEARAKAREAGLARQSERDVRLERLRAYNAPEARAERERVAKEKADQEAKERLTPPTPSILSNSFQQTKAPTERQVSYARELAAPIRSEGERNIRYAESGKRDATPKDAMRGRALTDMADHISNNVHRMDSNDVSFLISNMRGPISLARVLSLASDTRRANMGISQEWFESNKEILRSITRGLGPPDNFKSLEDLELELDNLLDRS